MSTARAILNFDDIHENNQNVGDDENADKNDDERGKEQGGNAPKEPEYCPCRFLDANAVEIKGKEA